MTVAAGLEAVLPSLYATPPAPLPFAPALHVRSYLLRRDDGNILIYGAPGAEPGAFEPAGGVARAYLGHGHEARFGPNLPDVPLFVHQADRAAVADARTVRAAFTQRHTFGDDLEVIPVRGHTPGSTAYLWDSGQHRLLFTADTIYLRDGEWVAGVLESSDRVALAASLDLIAGLDFDVLVPWAATAGDLPYAVVAEGEARRRIAALAGRLKATR